MSKCYVKPTNLYNILQKANFNFRKKNVFGIYVFGIKKLQNLSSEFKDDLLSKNSSFLL